MAGESLLNSTTTPLDAGQSYLGASENNFERDVFCNVVTDQDGVLYFEFSNDNINWNDFPPTGFEVRAGKPAAHNAFKGQRFFRIRFENTSGVNQTFLRLYTYFGDYRQLSAPLSLPQSNTADAILTRQLSELEVLKGGFSDIKVISKFGRNPDIDAGTAPEDVWNGGGAYTGFPTTAAENLVVVSDNAADTAAGTGGRSIRIFYHDENYNCFDSNNEFLFTDVVLNGTTPVNTGVLATRVWRAQIWGAGSSGSNVGTVTVRWATTTSVVFTQIAPLVGQSFSTAFTIPTGWTGYLKTLRASLNDGGTNRAEVVIRTRTIGTDPVVRQILPFSITDVSPSNQTFFGGSEFKEMTDIVVRVNSVLNNNASVAAGYGLLLVRN